MELTTKEKNYLRDLVANSWFFLKAIPKLDRKLSEKELEDLYKKLKES